MKLSFRVLLALLLLFGCSYAHGQTYIKLNGAYALLGVINPQAEFALSDRMAFQAELVFSPWKSVRWKGTDYPMRIFVVSNELRRYFRASNDGWYLGLNYGAQGFNMTKPELFNGKPRLSGHTGKGWGVQTGLAIGYEHAFAQRWLLDVYGSFGYQISWYNSYLLDGTIEDYPHGHDPNAPHDPWNASAEWGPNKIGVSIGYLLFKKKPL